MIISDLIMFASAYTNTSPTTFPVIIASEVRDNVYVEDDNDKLFHQSSPFRKTIATSRQFKQNRHNIDANLEQIDVKDVKWFSFCNPFYFCRNLKTEQDTLTYRYERRAFVYDSEKDPLLSAVNFYNMGNLNTSSMQEISSLFEVKVAARVDKDLQESVKLKKEEPEQVIKTDSLHLFSEEEEDAFKHKASGTDDAFTTEDSSSYEKETGIMPAAFEN
ncbi:lytic transglycosylase domain-containing protein [Bartonella massiliensis]|uniref:lytic transglycosylase domain-containing protein n=1 Tax=Bartonella massiliensis TaxID=929795 RepID=UPI001159FD19|nr:lytic transglycosylase domain-containing protein [Bartonella massiliensis]